LSAVRPTTGSLIHRIHLVRRPRVLAPVAGVRAHHQPLVGHELLQRVGADADRLAVGGLAAHAVVERLAGDRVLAHGGEQGGVGDLGDHVDGVIVDDHGVL
jgi:hypothetical protein